MDAITDEELTELALAADPDAPADEGAVPLWDVLHQADGAGPELLPAWYMPSPQVWAPGRWGWRRIVVLVLIASFLAINAYGLCSTYGWVGFG